MKMMMMTAKTMLMRTKNSTKATRSERVPLLLTVTESEHQSWLVKTAQLLHSPNVKNDGGRVPGWRNSEFYSWDDDTAVRNMLKAVLEADGFEVVAASNLSEALRCIVSGDFDVRRGRLHCRERHAPHSAAGSDAGAQRLPRATRSHVGNPYAG